MPQPTETLQRWKHELITEAADLVSQYDPAETQAFAARLRGVGNCETVGEALDLLPDMQVPAGFIHARYTIYEVIDSGRDNELTLDKPKATGELVQSNLAPLSFERLVCSALCLADNQNATSTGPGEWIESFALPIKDRGVFELALLVKRRQENDGSLDSRLQACRDLERDRVGRAGSGNAVPPVQRVPSHGQDGRHLFY
ncbi:hypothetical protein [Altererythrobacter sp. MTPC7]|uniref:hypothetical protein n=1 Tax=Altererythrobacter sp. MTPC7 TaxID=3056567 RepID=UPI0036F36C0F